MQKSLVRLAIIGVMAMALASCTAVRFGYNQGAELAFWWLDRYIDFNDAQEVKAREAIAEWFQWHRQTQLPEYATLLGRAQVEVAEPVTPAQVCKWIDTIQGRLDAAFDHALPALAESVRALSPEQLAHVERKYAKNLKEYKRDFLQSDLEDRRQVQIKRVVDRAEMVYGRLNDAQREKIVQLVAVSPFDPQAWLVERQRRQQDALQALRKMSVERAGPEEAKAVLKSLYEEMFRSPRDPYWAYQQRLMQFNCDFAAQVHKLSTAEQRANALKRFKGWEEDARALAAQGRS
jgi:hypothetical protein